MKIYYLFFFSFFSFASFIEMSTYLPASAPFAVSRIFEIFFIRMEGVYIIPYGKNFVKLLCFAT